MEGEASGIFLGRPWWRGRKTRCGWRVCLFFPAGHGGEGVEELRVVFVFYVWRLGLVRAAVGSLPRLAVVAMAAALTARSRCLQWRVDLGALLRWLSAVSSASHRTLWLEVNRSLLLQRFRLGVSPAALAQVALSPVLVRQPWLDARRFPGGGRRWT
jgi:hypothetical protein